MITKYPEINLSILESLNLKFHPPFSHQNMNYSIDGILTHLIIKHDKYMYVGCVFYFLHFMQYLYSEGVMHLCRLWKLGKDRLTIPKNYSRVRVYSLHLFAEYMLFVYNHE